MSLFAAFGRVRKAGSKVKLILLLDKAEKATDKDLKKYKKEYDVSAIAASKELFVKQADNGNIESADDDIIQRVIKSIQEKNQNALKFNAL